MIRPGWQAQAAPQQTKQQPWIPQRLTLPQRFGMRRNRFACEDAAGVWQFPVTLPIPAGAMTFFLDHTISHPGPCQLPVCAFPSNTIDTRQSPYRGSRRGIARVHTAAHANKPVFSLLLGEFRIGVIASSVRLGEKTQFIWYHVECVPRNVATSIAHPAVIAGYCGLSLKERSYINHILNAIRHQRPLAGYAAVHGNADPEHDKNLGSFASRILPAPHPHIAVLRQNYPNIAQRLIPAQPAQIAHTPFGPTPVSSSDRASLPSLSQPQPSPTTRQVSQYHLVPSPRLIYYRKNLLQAELYAKSWPSMSSTCFLPPLFVFCAQSSTLIPAAY